MAAAIDKALYYATLDHLVVILFGETGAGKSMFAERIHRASPRAAGPFGEANLGRMSESMAEAELFGHARGAFTDAKGERAGLCLSSHHGSLFLDEFGKASLGIQRQLLALLERRTIRRLGDDRDTPVDVRFIVGTNAHPKDLLKKGELLPDLYYRLGLNYVVIPPLRDRREDIPALAEHLIRELGPMSGYAPTALPTFHRDVELRFDRYRWPGNVRELRSVIETMLANARGARVLTTEHWPSELEDFDADTYENGAGAAVRREARKRAAQELAEKGASTSELMRVAGRGRTTTHNWTKDHKPRNGDDRA